MNDLLELAIAAHGGADRWNAVRRIHLHLSVDGALFRIKGLPDGMTDMLMSVDAREQAVKIAPYSRSDLRGGYLPNRVWIEDRKGAVVEELKNPRASFAGHVRETQWNQLQRLYFISYAFWNYLAIPFLLARPGFIARELGRHQEGSDSWRRLEVAFPADIATHCRTQVFYFSDDGLLKRHDYVTDVAGGVAANYCFDHVDFDGIVFPTLRRVVRRKDEVPDIAGPTAVLIQIPHLIVE
jgi:hypothetical protein